MTSRLREKYQKEVVPALTKEFGYKNVMAVPRIQKVVVNMGLGEATSNAKIIDTGADELARITGQKPVTRRSKKSIAQFKVRKGQPVGTMVTCAARHVGFPRSLMSIACPASDSRRLAEWVDGRGNYTLACATSCCSGDRLHEGRQGARHERLGRHDGETRGRRKLLQFIGMPSAELRTRGYDSKDCKEQKSEVQGPAANRATCADAARLHAEVRAVPLVLPQARA